jgi:hypothetical protein
LSRCSSCRNSLRHNDLHIGKSNESDNCTEQRGSVDAVVPVGRICNPSGLEGPLRNPSGVGPSAKTTLHVPLFSCHYSRAPAGRAGRGRSAQLHVRPRHRAIQFSHTPGKRVVRAGSGQACVGTSSTRDTYSRKTGGGKVSLLPYRLWGNEVTLTRRGHLFTNLRYDPP